LVLFYGRTLPALDELRILPAIEIEEDIKMPVGVGDHGNEGGSDMSRLKNAPNIRQKALRLTHR